MVKYGMLSKQKSEKKHRHFFLGLGVTLIVGYAVIYLVVMQVEIAQKSNEYESIRAQRLAIEAENEQLERYSSDEYRSEYIEEIARGDLDYSYPDEKIYYFVPSTD